MWEHLTAPQNLLFGISLIFLLALFTLQLIGQLVGTELFAWMDSITPDLPDLGVDLDLDLDVDLDAAGSVGAGGFIDHLFALLNLGRVPIVISLIVFLFLFSCIGYNLQFVLHEMGIPYLPLLGASAISLAATLPLLRFSNAGLARILPKDETQAVSEETFIGRVATITIGTVTTERQSEARLVGPLGRTHYIQVIADNEGVEFHQGDEVLVVGRKGALFTIIAVNTPSLRSDTFERKTD